MTHKVIVIGVVKSVPFSTVNVALNVPPVWIELFLVKSALGQRWTFELFDKYSLENRMAILKHEVLHIVNGHLTHRIQGKNIDSKKANIAFDCSINQLITPEHLPFNCVNVNYIQELIAPFSTEKVKYNETAEYYYNLFHTSIFILNKKTEKHIFYRKLL